MTKNLLWILNGVHHRLLGLTLFTSVVTWYFPKGDDGLRSGSQRRLFSFLLVVAHYKYIHIYTYYIIETLANSLCC